MLVRENVLLSELKSLPSKLRYLALLLREGGFKHAYNYFWYHAFYGPGFLPRLFLIHLYPWCVFYPPCIEIEVTTRCNMKCIMCEHTYWNEKGRDMSFEEFKGIVDQFPKLKWIGLTGIGESFLNKDFLKMLRYVKSKSIFVELYDTFYFVDEKIARELVEMGVDRIDMSIDAATNETYEKIRIGSNFERVINNFKTLVRLKKEMNAHFPELGFHYIVLKSNVNEIPQFIELANSLGAGENIKIFFSRTLHEFEEIKDKAMDIPEEIIRAAEKKARELGIRVAWNKDVPKIKPPISQCTVWIMPFIFVTGHVIPCCAGNEANLREFQKKYSLGNVFEKSFKGIWHSEKYTRLRRMIHEGRVPIQCKNCYSFGTREEK